MLPRQHRVRTSSEFGFALRSGARFGGRNLVVFLADLPDGEAPSTVGFLVSKKVGNAVTRNRVKRRLREKAAGFVAERPAGASLVVRALPPAAGLTFEELAADFERMLRGAVSKAERRRGRR
ncbi:ribonuclease P protein component [Arthrobacter sp. UM1]|uniref:ribonuclease P protein component n=1 Tax=Arthrobacter sp. UM1 TaxID=2766776 RepID=UPI001CF65B90|nr:ribonuclease P protein component [Arthrobacter sp. UM1]MCB4208631.1 ribonuclease P protein component [Arthrobacter sp. UM1]